MSFLEADGAEEGSGSLGVDFCRGKISDIDANLSSKLSSLFVRRPRCGNMSYPPIKIGWHATNITALHTFPCKSSPCI